MINNIEYRVSLIDCDVLNREALCSFRRKRREWLDWLNGEDDHAIGKQINLMSWHYAVFRIHNECRKLAASRKQRSAALNPVFAEFADTGFVAVQALAVRRLMEPGKRKSAKQVISLKRLVDDLLDHQHLFTRENFVGYDGCPFDPEPAKARWWQRTSQRLEEAGGIACWSGENLTYGAEAWGHAEHLHLIFDKLCRRNPAMRQRSDRIDISILNQLNITMNDEAIGKASIFCDKMIAHAADSESRLEKGPLLDGLSFQLLDNAHEAIITVAEFVAGTLLGDTIANPIAIPQFDILEQLDASWIARSDRESLQNCWREMSTQRENWTRAAENRIFSE